MAALDLNIGGVQSVGSGGTNAQAARAMLGYDSAVDVMVKYPGLIKGVNAVSSDPIGDTAEFAYGVVRVQNAAVLPAILI